MARGLDERLMEAINTEAERDRLRTGCIIHLRETAERLHAIHPLRTVDEIESRMKLAAWPYGLLSPHSTNKSETT